jgi:uncharacterized protein YyaL (SSP411 family)
LAAARTAGKPILLSVGYSACHWCHVMAHESFENAAIAAIMNRDFINIKVDREERPDVDAIYQKALAIIGEEGGWPLTMFLMPDGQPFLGGTYYPPTPAYGRPSFIQVLEYMKKAWNERRADLVTQSKGIMELVAGQSHERLRDGMSIKMLDSAAERLLDYIDLSDGGMNGAPKFPMPFVFEFLWRAYKRVGDVRYRDAVLVSLTRMCQGGIYDHVGGGFARYSTDPMWLVPHFEKMLYDNAQLIQLLTLVWQETKTPLYAARVRETIEWLIREMIGENGAFTAALDADSDGEEGKFYIWTEAEIDAALGSDAAFFKAAYNFVPGGNWEEEHTILNRSAAGDKLLGDADEALLAKCRAILLDKRASRVRPGRDDKILTDWNGLTISALARAGFAFGNEQWIELAETTFRRITETMSWTDDQGRVRLGHSWCGGRTQRAAMLDDYANMINAALVLYSGAGGEHYLTHAEAWVATANALYWDNDASGYFFTAADANDLIVRTKTANDTAVPSGNGSMVFALAHLFYLTGKSSYREYAVGTVTALGVDATTSFPHGATLLNAYEFLEAAVQVVIVGAPGEAGEILAPLDDLSIPNLVLDFVDDPTRLPAAHPAHGKTQVSGAVTAYVCRGPVCSAPQTTAAGLRAVLVS